MSKIEAFHVGEYISDELEARGMTVRQLAELMGGDVDENELTLELTIANVGGAACWMDEETAKGLERAWGTNAQTWLNLDAAYRRSMGFPSPPATNERKDGT